MKLLSSSRPAGTGAAIGPVQQLDGVHDGDVEVGREVRDATDVAGRDHVGAGGAEMLELALLELACDLRLQNIVGAGRAAADVALGNIDDGEARLTQEEAGLVMDALAVLQRAGRMIGDAERRPALRCAELIPRQELRRRLSPGSRLGEPSPHIRGRRAEGGRSLSQRCRSPRR